MKRFYKEMAKKILLTICIVFFSIISFATNYYVSNSGNDLNDGLTPETSWLTLTKVNAISFVGGDNILFKRGDLWFGTLIVRNGASGNPIVYSAYGTGNKPILHNSVLLNNISDWTEESTNVWRTVTTFPYDIGNVIFNNEQSVGVKKWNKVDITAQGQYWYDGANALLYLNSTSNPASFYTEVRACLNYPIINMSSRSNVTVDNLAVRYGAANGIHGTYSNGITITNCDVSWIGGGSLGGTTRYGNGIQFYYSAQNILVENCRIWEMYDTGITNQYQPTTGTIIHSNITYRNNTIWNCEWSFEYYNRSITGETSNVYFENNTCYNAGGSWAHAQRPDKKGYHLRLAGTPDNTTNFVIRNNIFHTATESIHYNYHASGVYTINHNCYYQPVGIYAFTVPKMTPYSVFANYQAATNWDSNSINMNPLFKEAGTLDFSLTEISPCIDAGDPTSPLDPDGTRTDIGAIYLSHFTEYISICDGTIYNGWTTTGKYERTLVAKSGSDSIVTTYLTVNPKYSVSEDITINEGEAYNGWTESGKYTRNLTSVLGCDSIVTTNLTVESLIIKQGSIPPTHFIPVWQGENGLNHMNIMVISAILEDLPLSPEDEIAVFSGSICVGSMKLSETIIADDNSTYLTISASQDDGSGNGFILNDTIVFKIWDNKNQQEMIAKAVVYRNNISTWLTSGKYAAGATSVVEIVSYTEYSQTIALKKGYNMISTSVTAQNPLACDVTQSLADAGYLIKLQDEAGNSLEDWGTFGGWINNIGSIEDTEGYKIKVTDNCSLQITGRPIVLPLDIPLRSGWNIISFPRTDLVDAMNIIQPLIDQNLLVKVQDESGNSIEDWGIFGGWKNGIGYFTPGKAYKVKMNADASLTIQENYLKSVFMLANLEEPEYFTTEVEGNGSDHVNINVVGLREAGISAGDELAAFDGNLCVGVLKITGNNIIDGSAALVASVSSSDQANDGYTEGHTIQLIAWNKLTGSESKVQADVISGQMKYIKNSSVLLKVKTLTTGISNFNDISTIDVFPNPSHGKVTVRFSSIPDAGSRIDILDISGRKVTSRLVSGMVEEFQLGNQPAGIYLVKTMFGSTETINKLVIN